VLHQTPERWLKEKEISNSRWRIKLIQKAVPWLEKLSVSGVWRQLRRLGIRLKGGRGYIHSPDPQYEEKLAAVNACVERAAKSHGREVALYEDECSFYRQPEVGADYCQVGSAIQPLARMSHRSNTVAREAAVINAQNAAVLHRQASKLTPSQMLKFYREICQRYPDAEGIYLIEDNWPHHYHPELLAHLEEQETAFTLKVPSTWKTEKIEERCAKIRAKESGHLLPIQIVPLPTYAPWTNPIEKLWKKLQQDYLKMHRKADLWNELKEGVESYLDQFKEGSATLLRYVGLTPKQTGRRSRAAAVAHSPP
jgi:DDE superfamily endonuclease